MVGTSLPCRVETTLFEYDTVSSDIDHFMAHVSVGLSQNFHVDKLIELVKVRFEDNLQIYLAHTSCRHNKVTEDMIAMKWEISN